ncbi:MAG: hypothetical protein ACO2OO_02615 [Candidatus Aenigmatarchaeota archaeon]|jgi:hypothetical protein
MFGIKNPFKKEKKEVDIPLPPQQPLPTEVKEESVKVEPIPETKIKEIEVLNAKIDALKFQYEALNEKINNIEKMVREIYQLAKESS